MAVERVAPWTPADDSQPIPRNCANCKRSRHEQIDKRQRFRWDYICTLGGLHLAPESRDPCDGHRFKRGYWRPNGVHFEKVEEPD